MIRKLRTCLRLSPSKRRLALKTIGLVALIRLGTWVLPFRTLQRVSEYLRRPDRKGQGNAVGAQDIVWAVCLAARYIPRATCLVQALAAHILLGRHGHPGELHIGVALDANRAFRAHAWVESGGEVVIGQSEEPYSKILVLEGSVQAPIASPAARRPD